MELSVSRIFFSKTNSINIGIFRFLFCSLLPLLYLSSYSKGYEILFHNGLIEPPVNYLDWSFFGFKLIIILKYLLFIGLVFSSLGIFTRFSLASTTFLFFIYEFPISSILKPYTTNIVFFNLLILSLAPGVQRFSFDQYFLNKKHADFKHSLSWSTELIKLTLGMVYFNAFISKIVNGGWSWATSGNFQGYLFGRYLFTQNEYALWLATTHPILGNMASLAGGLVEALFWTVIFFPRWAWIYALIGISFHFIVLLTFELNFLYPFALSYLVFIDWKLVAKRLNFST